MGDGLSVCAMENQNEGETETTNVQKTEDIDCQICHEESLKPVNVSAKEDKNWTRRSTRPRFAFENRRSLE